MTEHDLAALGGYALGELEPDEARAVEAHTAGCASCAVELAELTEARDWLGGVPPEAFLDGPPETDLPLLRALEQMRVEMGEAPDAPAELPDTTTASVGTTSPAAPKRLRGRRALTLAAGIAILAAGGVAGGVIGRQTAPSAQTAIGPGAKTLTASDPRTGASMTVALTPAAGWVRLHAKVAGVPVGTPCQIVVVGRDGTSVVAGSWLVSPVGAKQGTTLDGSAILALSDVASVKVVTLSGQDLVTATA